MPCRALDAFGLTDEPPGDFAPLFVLMPCRALDAFGRQRGPLGVRGIQARVLMPCRALDAFGLRLGGEWPRDTIKVLMPCRALDAFGRITPARPWGGIDISLNALSGIGCIRTNRPKPGCCRATVGVLMPCRALDAFGPRGLWSTR